MKSCLIKLKEKVQNLTYHSQSKQKKKHLYTFLQITSSISCDTNQIDDFSNLNSEIFIYWRNYRINQIIYALGAVDHLTGQNQSELNSTYQDIVKKLDTIDGKARYFFGQSFHFTESNIETNLFSEFDNFHFILPQLEIRSLGNNQELIANFLFEDQAKFEYQVQQCIKLINLLIEYQQVQHSYRNEHQPLFTLKTNHTKQTWQVMIKDALNLIKTKVIEKIALSKVTTLIFQEPIDENVLFNQLKNRANSGTTYFFKIKKSSAFMGCSPEQLFVRESRKIYSDSIAGTVSNTDNDSQNSVDDLYSEKNILEHHLVSQFILKALQEICDGEIKISELSKISSHTIDHLYQTLQGKLKEGITDLDIINQMHPTPAVGVLPKKEINQIQNLEKKHRGWYAAPMGWIGSESTEILVAIRSALLNQNQLNVFSGVGIVEKSNPEDEWKEVSDKCELILDLLGFESSALELDR